jgi:hypothetical protein
MMDLFHQLDGARIIAGIVSALIVFALGKILGVQLDKDQRAKLDWAIKQGVSAAAERIAPGSGSGAEKKKLAIETAESLAPKAMAKLDDEQKSVLVDATYAQLRPALHHPWNTTFVHHGEGLAQPVDVVRQPAADDAPTLPPLKRPMLPPKKETP